MAALRLKWHGKDTNAEIQRIVSFHIWTLYRMQARFRRTGDVAKAEVLGCGHPRSLVEADAIYLVSLSKWNPALFLDEYQKRLERYHLVHTSLATIHRVFQHAGFSVKWIKKMAKECCPIKRASFMRWISQYPASYLLCMDEVSKDDRTYAWLFAQAPRGQRALVSQPFVWKMWFSMCATMALGEGIIASKVVEGSFDREKFIAYLRDDVVRPIIVAAALDQKLIFSLVAIYKSISGALQCSGDGQHLHPSLWGNWRPCSCIWYVGINSFPGILIWLSAGCRIEYLPPYSPDYNPIEQAFSVIKSHLQCQGIAFFQSKFQYYELYLACEVITGEMMYGFFRNSGYYIE